jgi:hypothetical protein
MAEQKRTFVERRKGPDAVVKAVWWSTGICWALFVAALIFFDTARPESSTFFDRQFDIAVRDYWNENALQYSFFIMILNLAVCIAGFILNMARHRRKTDKISKSILILGTVTLTGIIWYLLR